MRGVARRCAGPRDRPSRELGQWRVSRRRSKRACATGRWPFPPDGRPATTSAVPPTRAGTDWSTAFCLTPSACRARSVMSWSQLGLRTQLPDQLPGTAAAGRRLRGKSQRPDLPSQAGTLRLGEHVAPSVLSDLDSDDVVSEHSHPLSPWPGRIPDRVVSAWPLRAHRAVTQVARWLSA